MKSQFIQNLLNFMGNYTHISDFFPLVHIVYLKRMAIFCYFGHITRRIRQGCVWSCVIEKMVDFVFFCLFFMQKMNINPYYVNAFFIVFGVLRLYILDTKRDSVRQILSHTEGRRDMHPQLISYDNSISCAGLSRLTEYNDLQPIADRKGVSRRQRRVELQNPDLRYASELYKREYNKLYFGLHMRRTPCEIPSIGDVFKYREHEIDCASTVVAGVSSLGLRDEKECLLVVDAVYNNFVHCRDVNTGFGRSIPKWKFTLGHCEYDLLMKHPECVNRAKETVDIPLLKELLKLASEMEA